jgi:hypothetical protein
MNLICLLNKIYRRLLFTFELCLELMFCYPKLRLFLNCGPNLYVSDKRVDGKVIIITGANSGIGRETAMDLARRGGKVR